MFGLFRRKVNTQDVKAFESAVNAINIYVALSDWEKAKMAAHEIISKEKKSLENLIQNNNWDKKFEKKNIAIFEKKEEKIKKLLAKIELLEKDYNDKLKIERFNVRIKSIKKEIDKLISQSKTNDALSLLNSFYKENENEISVINFYKKEKIVIQRAINKKIWRLDDRTKTNAKLEAMTLIWEDYKATEEEKIKKEELWFFQRLKAKFTFWKALNKKREEKKLLDEVNILIEEDSKVKKELAAKKLEKMHSWLIKELVYDNMIWYDLYWKILWADKISGDTFGLEENRNNYLMFLWDATGHWVRAGFIISVFNQLFKTFKEKSIKDIYIDINNQLKQKLESKNFVTWALFEISKWWASIKYAWMWHEPIFIYREKTWEVEKKVLWWLAAGFRIIKDANQVKIRDIKLEDWDILMIFSDWIVEAKWGNGELYGIDRLGETFKKVLKFESDIRKIYNFLIEDLKWFKWWTKFEDDASILLLKRDTNRDLVRKWDQILEDIKEKENLKSDELKRLEWERRENLSKKLEAIRREKETKRIISILWELYYSWEILQLKQEAIRYIKEWYIDKKINFYLRKAIENENNYRIEQKNQKMQNKYNVLLWLYKKWDYDTVIKELEYIIRKDWNF